MKMTRVCLLSIFFMTSLLSSSAAFSSAIVEEGYYLFDKKKLLFDQIRQQEGLTIDHLGSAGYEVYGPRGSGDWLKSVSEIYDIKMMGLDEETKETPFNNYPSHEEITQKLFELQAQYPEILQITSLGQSKNGRDLWSAKISSNVLVDEVEPEFKYIANMHGDEIVGRELMLLLIEDILNQYEVGNRMIRSLVENTEIYIIPSMNPDGASSRRRGNANYVDLNRNFPDFTRDRDSNPQNRELETQAIMTFQAQRKFALSANFHGGVECVNYPWDTKQDHFPLVNLARHLSIEYAQEVPGMANSRQFDGGVTNGYDWYPIKGGMQDWSYFWFNDLQVTIELSDAKWPNYQTIPQYYNWNRNSIIRYMTRVHQGAGFKLDSKNSGQVEIIQENGFSLGRFGFSDGEFYKVLEPGQYKMIVTETSGRERVFETIVTAQNGAFKPNYIFLN